MKNETRPWALAHASAGAHDMENQLKVFAMSAGGLVIMGAIFHAVTGIDPRP